MELWLSFDFVLALVFSLLIGWVLWRWNEIWYVGPIKSLCTRQKLKLPPGEMGFPIFGEVLTFLWHFKMAGRPDDFINNKIRKFGGNVGAFRSFLFGSPSIIVYSPSLCKFVLHATGSKFRQEWPTVKVLGPNSVITLVGQRHTTIKGIVLNAINRPESLAKVVSQLNPIIDSTLQSWSLMGKINAMAEMKKVTLKYIGMYSASLEIDEKNIDAFHKTFVGVLQGFRATPWNFPGTSYHLAVKCRKKITDILKRELEKKKKRNANLTEYNSDPCKDHGDLMDRLMVMKDEEGKYLKDEEVLDNVLSSTQLGYLTITYMVSWALHFLAKSPHVLQKLREENIQMSKEKKGYITYEDVMKLTYTNKVVEETIRLANTSGFVFRKANEDIEVEGFMIPKGWQVICWVRYLHTDPNNFEDPMCFNPDRWNTRPKYGTYFTFGGGPRSCAGSSLVRVNLALYLHHLSIGYKWELLNPDTKITYLSHPHLADGVEINFSKI